MTHEEFMRHQSEMPNDELIRKVEEGLMKLCKEPKAGFVMHVPARVDDFDMLVSELINRYKTSCEGK